MEYYTQKEPLLLAEYGRHIQDMVLHALTISDRDERNKAAQTIIQVMNVFNPSYKESDELQQKLWDDMIVMSRYQLDIDGPYPKPEPTNSEPLTRIPYPDQNIKFRHYGKVIEELIEKALELSDEAQKQELTQIIANLMKKSYLNFNRDSVNEEMIVDQLTSMSKGRLKLNDDFRFHHTNDILKARPQQSTGRPGQGGKNRKKKWKKHN